VDPDGVGGRPGGAAGTDLLGRIRRRSDADGFVPFDRFMEEALYAPEVGYYARPESPFGARGDYYTAPRVHPLFARTLASRIRRGLDGLPAGPPRKVVELGPGDGGLTAGILEAFASDPPRGAVDWVLVERSEARAERALGATRPAGARAGIAVRRSGSVGALGPFSGVVLANELFDALPCRRFRRTDPGWAELGVRLDRDRVVPVERPIAGERVPDFLPPQAEPGTVLERTETLDALLREAADHVVTGEMIVLDYGMSASELRAAHPRGTLQSIRRHRASDDPLEAPGAVDLSTFVDTDRLRAAAQAAGWSERSFQSQAQALGEWGFPEHLERALKVAGSPEEEVRVRLAAKNLLFGFDRFFALELRAGRSRLIVPAAPGS